MLNIWDSSGSEQAGDPGRFQEQDGEGKKSVWEFREPGSLGVAWEVSKPAEGDSIRGGVKAASSGLVNSGSLGVAFEGRTEEGEISVAPSGERRSRKETTCLYNSLKMSYKYTVRLNHFDPHHMSIPTSAPPLKAFYLLYIFVGVMCSCKSSNMGAGNLSLLGEQEAF